MKEILDRLGACRVAREWVGDRTLAEAWAECDRPDWLLWLHSRSVSADAAGYSALSDKWAEAAAEAAEAEAAAAEAGKQAAMDGANSARVWATDEWAVDESRARQCNDIRAALCCPVFNTPGEGGKDGSR